MLTDGLRLLDATEIERTLPSSDKGTAFPASPTNGQLFELTQASGNYAAGVYRYSADLTDWLLDVVVIPHDLSVYVASAPEADEQVFASKYQTGTRLNLASASVSAAVAPTLAVTYALKKNGADIATLVFTASNAAGTVSAAQSSVVVKAGDVISLHAGSSVDPDIKGISLSVPGIVIR